MGIRTALAREIFPEERAALAPYGARYRQPAPLVPWVMVFNLVLAGLTRRVEWRGRHYGLRSVDEIRLLRRAEGRKRFAP